jgi:hypothetical protein
MEFQSTDIYLIVDIFLLLIGIGPKIALARCGSRYSHWLCPTC